MPDAGLVGGGHSLERGVVGVVWGGVAVLIEMGKGGEGQRTGGGDFYTLQWLASWSSPPPPPHTHTHTCCTIPTPHR